MDAISRFSARKASDVRILGDLLASGDAQGKAVNRLHVLTVERLEFHHEYISDGAFGRTKTTPGEQKRNRNTFVRRVGSAGIRRDGRGRHMSTLILSRNMQRAAPPGRFLTRYWRDHLGLSPNRAGDSSTDELASSATAVRDHATA